MKICCRLRPTPPQPSLIPIVQDPNFIPARFRPPERTDWCILYPLDGFIVAKVASTSRFDRPSVYIQTGCFHLLNKLPNRWPWSWFRTGQSAITGRQTLQLPTEREFYREVLYCSKIVINAHFSILDSKGTGRSTSCGSFDTTPTFCIDLEITNECVVAAGKSLDN
jgi:hypothetical protein